jgi:hypothetical protein
MTTLAIALLAWYAAGGITTAAFIPSIRRKSKINARREEVREEMTEMVETHAKANWSISRLAHAISWTDFDLKYSREFRRNLMAREILEDSEKAGILYRRPSNRYTFFYTKN